MCSGAQLSLCVCVVTTQAIHCPACPGLRVARHTAFVRTSGHHTSPHHRIPHAQQPREYVCHGVWCVLGVLVVCAVADLVEEVEEVAEADRFLAKVTPTPKPNCPQFKSCKKCNTVAKSTCH